MCRVQSQPCLAQHVVNIEQEVQLLQQEVKWWKRSHESLRKDHVCMREYMRNLNTQVQELSTQQWQMSIDAEEIVRSQSVQVFVRAAEGCLVFGVTPEATVFTLKNQILDRIGMPIELQVLVLEGGSSKTITS